MKKDVILDQFDNKKDLINKDSSVDAMLKFLVEIRERFTLPLVLRHSCSSKQYILFDKKYISTPYLKQYYI